MSRTTFTQNNPEFSRTLRQRVDRYFNERGISTSGNWKIHIKAAVLLVSAAFLYVLLLSGVLPVWALILGCIVLGAVLASIGFNLMHEGAHGSYSDIKWLNEFMGYTLNLLGGNLAIWKQKHNNAHHTYTNIQGHDDDINIEPWIRTNRGQKRRWYHRYQHVYGLILYSFTYLIWVYREDYNKYFTGKIAENYPLRRLSLRDHLIFWISKIVHIAIVLVIPMIAIGWQETLAGYFILCATIGFTLGLVFQLAHLVEETQFPVADGRTGDIENEWTIHQLSTTANFSTRSRILSWYVGGLNFQVEHHLFPKISHVHYPNVSKIVKQVCDEFNVKYNEYPNLFLALRSHLVYLRAVGRD